MKKKKKTKQLFSRFLLATLIFFFSFCKQSRTHDNQERNFVKNKY